MATIIVRFAEIALKGQNRGHFVHQLMSHIRRAAGLKDHEVLRQNGQILLRFEDDRADEVRHALTKVFGIAWFADAATTTSSLDAIGEAALKLAAPHLNPDRTFAIDTKRSIKSLPFTSDEVNRVVGDLVRQTTGAKVNLSQPDVKINIHARGKHTYLFTGRTAGPGGLPVGTNGRVLSLLSGGFDSIVSSYMLARRGTQVDFLHFHVFPRAAGVMSTKMPRLWAKLSQHTLSERVFLANYAPFQLAVLGLPRRLERYELVVFRRLMARVGEILAQRYDYQALALGDSLGQVASQTIENIAAVEDAVSMPIFRPLIGMDKVEVIDLVRRIDLEAEAAAPYKDCCSIVSRHPSTRAKLDLIREMEQAANVEQVAAQIADQIEIVEIGPGELHSAGQPSPYAEPRIERA